MCICSFKAGSDLCMGQWDITFVEHTLKWQWISIKQCSLASRKWWCFSIITRNLNLRGAYQNTLTRLWITNMAKSFSEICLCRGSPFMTWVTYITKCAMESFIHPQTSTAVLLQSGNGQIISSHTFMLLKRATERSIGGMDKWLEESLLIAGQPATKQ